MERWTQQTEMYLQTSRIVSGFLCKFSRRMPLVMPHILVSVTQNEDQMILISIKQVFLLPLRAYLQLIP
jgi:hypothetical protein